MADSLRDGLLKGGRGWEGEGRLRRTGTLMV